MSFIDHVIGHNLLVMTMHPNNDQNECVEHDLSKKIVETATQAPDLNVMEWPRLAHYVGCVAWLAQTGSPYT